MEKLVISYPQQEFQQIHFLFKSHIFICSYKSRLDTLFEGNFLFTKNDIIYVCDFGEDHQVPAESKIIEIKSTILSIDQS